MASRKQPPDPNSAKYLLFIDTNIWLDFYRMESGEGAADTLELIEHARSRIIATDQVQMEFMKNRQKTILQMLERFKASDSMALPPIVADRKAAQAMRAQKKAMDERRNKLRKHVEQVLLNPATHDPVFRGMQALFVSPGDLVLCRPKDERYSVRELAEKRWRLGYPPRKDDDTSIGDAINWEWIIDCASRRGGHAIIVSRDHDYGRAHGGHVFLNDWLQREFKERVPGRCKVVMTNRLSAAFKLMDVRVPQPVIEAEGKLLVATATFIAGKATTTQDPGDPGDLL